jgi:hypothetical protein
VKTTESKAAAAATISAGLGRRKRAELLELLRPCFARVEPWLQAGKYTAALMSDLPRRNGWTLAERAGDRTPDRMQRLLSRARPSAPTRRQPALAGLATPPPGPVSLVPPPHPARPEQILLVSYGSCSSL